MSESPSSEPLTTEFLTGIGLHDPAFAVRLVRELAGDGVTDDDLASLLPYLYVSLARCPDPDRALHSFARWFESVGSRLSHLQLLVRHTVALELFCQVTGSSQYFADLLVRQPECFDIIANPGVRGGTKSGARLYREASAIVDVCQRHELKCDALRRWKAREMLRIGVRDLVGLADLPGTAREFSNLADACIQKALDIAYSEKPVAGRDGASLPFAVIAMGKLGGQELNYSSDVDLMFVHGDELPGQVELRVGGRTDTSAYLTRLAERVIAILAHESANGHVFRVDMRLRPEGRFGPLSRSLAGFKAYYESWAEGWERQALLKARFVAGDRTIGEAFHALIAPFVYRRSVSLAFLDEVRANKRRIEKKCALEGQTLTNVKTGYGGIRDVEFIVQRLLLEFGGAWPSVRSPNTLVALQRLRRAGMIPDRAAALLADDYRFLRTLEHRLQLLHGFQTQTLPSPEHDRERELLARRMGYADRIEFERDLALRRDRTRRSLDALFYGDGQGIDGLDADTPAAGFWSDLPDLLDNLDSPTAYDRLRNMLLNAGFANADAAIRTLDLSMRGNEFGGMPPETRVHFNAIAPSLLQLAAASADPDAGLAGIEGLALAVPNRAQLYAALAASPDVLARLVRLGGASPPLVTALARHQEWLETIVSQDDAGEGSELGLSDTYVALYAAWLARASDRAERLDAVARVYQREILKIGARDSWDEIDTLGVMAALTGLADATIQVLLQLAGDVVAARDPDPEVARAILSGVAVVGLGKLGGEELGYSSDWDLVFTVRDAHGEQFPMSDPRWSVLPVLLVEQVLADIGELRMRGASVEMDLRLRPWGKKGALIQSPRSFLEYFQASAETWERQASLKARFVAGDGHAGRRLVRLLRAVSFGAGTDSAADAEVRAMKRRIETERLKPTEHDTDVKLGYGGMTDVEWLVQRFQLQHGRRCPGIRCAHTVRALGRLAAHGLLTNAEADVLIANYLSLTRLRNGLWLLTGIPLDVLPLGSPRLAILARARGFAEDENVTASEALLQEVGSQMRETRRIFMDRFNGPKGGRTTPA